MAFETPVDGCKKTRTIKESMAWRMIFMSIILKKRALSKVNFQPVHALKIPESAFALACSRLRDSGGKSFSKKKCEKRAGAGDPPFPSRARLIFALLVLICSHYTI